MRVSTGLGSVVVAGLLLGVNVSASARVGPAIPKNKKVLLWGTNAVDASYIPKHVSTIEERWPVDGIIMSVHSDDWKYRRIGQEGVFFGGKEFARDDFKQAVANLKSTKFKRYTDNFVHISAQAIGAKYAAEYGNLDWYDPKWSVVANNGGVLAWVAKEGGLKGFQFDVEAYTGSPTPWRGGIFNYEKRPDKDKRSFENVAAQVRMRGREWMEAVTAAYPDITIMIIQTTAAWRSNRTVLPWERVDDDHALVQHFVEGMLERRGKATIIDGIERGYGCNTYDTFKALKEEAATRGFGDIEYGFGIWLDRLSTNQNESGYKGFYTEPERWEENYRSPWRLEHTLYDALTVSDRYVWIFLQHGHYLVQPEQRPKGFAPEWDICPGCPHGGYGVGLPQAYSDALLNCRKPHALNQVTDVPMTREYAKIFPRLAKAENLLKNGSFEEWVAGRGLPKHWQVRGAPGREKSSVKEGNNSLLMSDVGYYNWVEQTIPASSCAGKTVVFAGWVRASVRDMIRLEILDHADGEYTLASSGHYPGTGSWKFLIARKKISPDATGDVWFRFHIRARLPDGKVYLDGARVVIED